MKKGFTLIELLVVISIIAMLLAILMPALGKVKATASRVVCSTNQRQMGQAFYIYTNDYDGKMLEIAGPAAIYLWGGITLDEDYKYLPLNKGWDPVTKPYDRPLNAYLPDDNPVYICPRDPKGDTVQMAPFGITGSSHNSTQAYYSSAGTSLIYNYYLAAYTPGKNTSGIVTPAKSILFTECPAFDTLGKYRRPGNWTTKPRWSFHDNSGRGAEPEENEKNGNNTCFADGHVGYVDYIPTKAETKDYRWFKKTK